MRYTNLDLLRGLCLLIMTIDHFGDLSLVRVFGFFTAAEGFVFISGLVAGIVYYKRFLKTSFDQVKDSAYKRSFQIYKYHLLCILCLCLIILTKDDFLTNYYEVKAPLFVENLYLAAGLNAIFIYKIYHLDILPMYVIFLLLVPLALKLSAKYRPEFFLFISFLIWFFNQLGLTDYIYKALNDFVPTRLGEFEVLSWQFLFFTGLYLGILQVKGKLNFSFLNSKYVFVSVILLALFLGLKWLAPVELVPDLLIDRQKLGILRIVNFLVLSYFVGFLLTKYKYLGKNKMLQMLGRQSLYVYTFQVLILFMFIPFYHELYVHGFLEKNIGSKIIWKLAVVISTIPLAMIIFIPAFYKERKLIPKSV